MGNKHDGLPEIKQLMRELLLNNEKMSGKELKENVEKTLKYVSRNIRTYQILKRNLLPEVQLLKTDVLEKPWSVVTLPDNSIDAQALPVVLKIWKMQTEAYFKKLEKEPKAKDGLLTIRQALWISRIYLVVKHETDFELDCLYELASTVALAEQLEKMRGGYNKIPEGWFGFWAVADIKLMSSKVIETGLFTPWLSKTSGKLPETT